MGSPTPQTVTTLLREMREGDQEAFDTLFTLVYDELHRLARVVRGGQGDVTLNTTGLVHEAYLQLLPSGDLALSDRAHFFRVAARAMRQVIVRVAKNRMAQKRGGAQFHVTFDEAHVPEPVRAAGVLDLDEALSTLEALMPRQAQVVECRYFAGLTVAETAEALGIGSATVKRDWRTARAWLINELRA